MTSPTDALANVLRTAQGVLHELRDPAHLVPEHHGETAVRPLPGPRLPIDPTVLDVRAQAAKLLGNPTQEAADQVAALMMRSLTDVEERRETMERVLAATGEGRLFLAQRRGHTPLRCPACEHLSVILAEHTPGILECQRDACAPEAGGPLRRYTLETIGYGDPDALVTIPEVARVTSVPAGTWAERLRRKKIKPSGKRHVGACRPQGLYPWSVFANWEDGRGRQDLRELPPPTS